ncbi:hypothetical protein AVEN_195398-1 [Araneus ventricosus]|uniref:Uncharacterized protein n=1 Tax=Araneus ventricosus TaxID=182803 RepID=A0A4Y2V9H9_ARAVE|nr:hypothetical protein AVEN_195398-1 [Araneus ventricosus]
MCANLFVFPRKSMKGKKKEKIEGRRHISYTFTSPFFYTLKKERNRIKKIKKMPSVLLIGGWKGLMRRQCLLGSSMACPGGILGMPATLLERHAGCPVTSLPGHVNSFVEPSNVPSPPPSIVYLLI